MTDNISRCIHCIQWWAALIAGRSWCGNIKHAFCPLPLWAVRQISTGRWRRSSALVMKNTALYLTSRMGTPSAARCRIETSLKKLLHCPSVSGPHRLVLVVELPRNCSVCIFFHFLQGVGGLMIIGQMFVSSRKSTAVKSVAAVIRSDLSTSGHNIPQPERVRWTCWEASTKTVVGSGT